MEYSQLAETFLWGIASKHKLLKSLRDRDDSVDHFACECSNSKPHEIPIWDLRDINFWQNEDKLAI